MSYRFHSDLQRIAEPVVIYKPEANLFILNDYPVFPDATLGFKNSGTAVAGAMAKIGIGKMLLSDYDVMGPSE